ncbi:serine hydrolase [Lentzea sp. CA-135723]|uniref:serine hydrolase n=1 Tax=Lentzea sp. CA-135723 TaxID=3239950 RepID=UPI003D9183DE
MKRWIPLVLLLTACQVPAPLAAEHAAEPVPVPAAAPSEVAEKKWTPNPGNVSVQFAGEYTWALRGNGIVLVGGQDIRTFTESMIKVWLALDLVAAKGSVVSEADTAAMAKMIRESDDKIAQRFYLNLGGDASVRRMISTCGLLETTVTPNWWSKTTLTANDAARLGQCLEIGPGISPQWRDRLLAMMRDIAPDGRFGIPQAPALQGKPLAIKNGWTRHDDKWTVTCLALWDGWSLAVLTRARSTDHLAGAQVCATVAQQLFSDAPEN